VKKENLVDHFWNPTICNFSRFLVKGEDPTPAWLALILNDYSRVVADIFWAENRMGALDRAISANETSVVLENFHGMMNAPLMTEPMAWLVKRYPRWEAFRCNSFKPNTGINEGIHLQSAKSVGRG
jgi:hypothetical protein